MTYAANLVLDEVFFPYLQTTNLTVKIVLSLVHVASLVYERENCGADDKTCKPPIGHFGKYHDNLCLFPPNFA